MKKLVCTLISGIAIAAGAASPTISGVSVRQDASRLVTINYTVDQDCIVTVDVTTNGVSIGVENFTNMVGAVNKKVAAGANTICWQPRASWPNKHIAAGGISVDVTAWPLCAPPPYMVIDLDRSGDGYLNDGEFVHYFASTNAFPGGFENRIYKTDTIVMRHIPAAGVMWKMGMTSADATAMGTDATKAPWTGSTLTRAEWEKCHYVMLTNDYWFAIYPATQKQCKWVNGGYMYNHYDGTLGTYYDQALGATVATTDRDILPQTALSYETIRGSVSTDGVDWPTTGYAKVGGLIKKFRNKTGGTMFDLPTDAQWEFACRAGESAMLYDGNPAYVNGTAQQKNGSSLGWLYYNYADGGSGSFVGNGTNTCYVGRFKPNSWGIYDLVGNVREPVLDYSAGDSHSPGSLEIDPRGPDTGIGSGGMRVIRSSAYDFNISDARSSCRNRLNATYVSHNIGFRLVITCP